MAPDYFQVTASAGEGQPASTLRIHKGFSSQLLPADRDLVVFVPPGYDENPEARYPVLYLHDGQNLFQPETSYSGEDWRVHETATTLIEAGEIEPLIVVGIYNTGEERIKEYTPTRDPKHGGGDADLYGRLLVEEVLPFINQNYRTLPGPLNTGLGGSSLGGLVTLYLGLHYPEVFGKLAVLSPAVWWNNKAILKMIEQFAVKPRLRIWLDMGTGEGGKSLADTEALRRALLAKGWMEPEELRYRTIPGGTHDEVSWRQRVGLVLKYLYPATVAESVPAGLETFMPVVGS